MIDQVFSDINDTYLKDFVKRYTCHSSDELECSYVIWKRRSMGRDHSHTLYENYAGMAKCAQILNIHAVENSGEKDD